MSSRVVSNRNPIVKSDTLLIDEYLKTIIIKTENNKTILEPWAILNDFCLARRLINRIIERFDFSETTGICALADSGLPLGVLLSQALGKPLYVSRRDPIMIEGLEELHHIFPEIPRDSKLSLVDSHCTTGYTSAYWASMLTKQGIEVLNIVAPISFIYDIQHNTENATTYKTDLTHRYLSESEDHEQLLLELYGNDSYSSVLRAIRHRTEEERNRKYPETGVDPEFPTPSKGERIHSIISELFKKRMNINYMNPEFAKQLRGKFQSDESDVWLFVTRPEDIKEVAQLVGSYNKLKDYKIIIGTGIIGTIFSLCLAWYSNYDGKLFSTYMPIDDGLFNHDNYRSGLIVSGRLRTGVFIRGTIEACEENKINIDEVIVLRYAPEKVEFPRSQMCKAIVRQLYGKLCIIS